VAETERITLPVELPLKSETVMMKDVSVKTSEGIPEIMQLELSIERPSGKSGEILQFITESLLFKIVGETDMGEKISTLVPKEPE
jgi:hypothetical protein